jgi:hypothetical protein
VSVGYAPAQSLTITDRVDQTVALLRRRGYALPPANLAELCLGGAVAESDVRAAVMASQDLIVAEGLVIERELAWTAGEITRRAASHAADAPAYLQLALSFVRTLVGAAPFIRSVSIAGSLASGGFRASDDIDLNLIVDDGHRHLAYVVVNLLGLVHAVGHRNKPVDDLTRRPIAPRLMTANLILERSQCYPLARQDEDMAFELLVAQPVFGLEVIHGVVDANPSLTEHFPQLASRTGQLAITPPRRRLPPALFPRAVDGIARLIGESAWRYMQWTRRGRPDALARVAYVRSTMRPYTLFDR